MSHRFALGVVLVGTAVLVGCSTDLRAPHDALIACSSSRHCPQSRRCELGVCVAGDPGTGPITTNVALAPNPAGSSAELVLTFDVDRALLQAPVVVLEQPAPLAFTLQGSFGPERRTFEYRLAGALSDGT